VAKCPGGPAAGGFSAALRGRAEAGGRQKAGRARSPSPREGTATARRGPTICLRPTLARPALAKSGFGSGDVRTSRKICT